MSLRRCAWGARPAPAGACPGVAGGCWGWGCWAAPCCRSNRPGCRRSRCTVRCFGLCGLAAVVLMQRRTGWVWLALVGALAGAVAWGGAGLRAAQLLRQTLAPELEGREDRKSVV